MVEHEKPKQNFDLNVLKQRVLSESGFLRAMLSGAQDALVNSVDVKFQKKLLVCRIMAGLDNISDENDMTTVDELVLNFSRSKNVITQLNSDFENVFQLGDRILENIPPFLHSEVQINLVFAGFELKNMIFADLFMKEILHWVVLTLVSNGCVTIEEIRQQEKAFIDSVRIFLFAGTQIFQCYADNYRAERSDSPFFQFIDGMDMSDLEE